MSERVARVVQQVAKVARAWVRRVARGMRKVSRVVREAVLRWERGGAAVGARGTRAMTRRGSALAFALLGWKGLVSSLETG